MAMLEWDHKDNNQLTAKQGVYIWYVQADGLMHTSTINTIF